MGQYDTRHEVAFFKGHKWICPQCHHKTFVPYVYTQTGEPVDANLYGKCERINHCRYELYPRLEGRRKHYQPPVVLPAPVPPSYMPRNRLLNSLCNYESNNFVAWLLSLPLPADSIRQAVQDYVVGTATDWKTGGTLFWQIDSRRCIRTGKYMLYQRNGHRSHENGSMNWTHCYPDKLEDYNLVQCLFGEHLLAKYPDRPAAIVESEKTAILASVVNDSYVWLATGGCGGLSSREKTGGLRCLRGRKIVLFPDWDDAGAKWYDEAEELARLGYKIEADNWAPRLCPDPCNIPDGWDIADAIVDRLTHPERYAGSDRYVTAPAAAPVPATTPRPPTAAAPDRYYPRMAYVDRRTGMCYIPEPDSITRYAARSIADYNNRKGTPQYVPADTIDWANVERVALGNDMIIH